MRARNTACVVLAGAVMLATAGCGFVTPQSTSQHYDASDGFSADVGSIQLRNAMAFTKNGDVASLSVTLINTSSSAADVEFQYSSFGSPKTVSVTVPAHGEVRRGTHAGDKQLIVNGIGKQAGSLMKVFVQYGDTSGKSVEVPVLDGSFPQYANLLPSSTPRPQL